MKHSFELLDHFPAHYDRKDENSNSINYMDSYFHIVSHFITDLENIRVPNRYDLDHTQYTPSDPEDPSVNEQDVYFRYIKHYVS